MQPEAQDPRIFPHIFAKRNANVDFASCSFQKSNSTGEAYVVLTEIFPKTLNYEFRISPFDVTEPTEGNSEQKYRQHTPDSFRFLGRDLLETYLEYCRLS